MFKSIRLLYRIYLDIRGIPTYLILYCFENDLDHGGGAVGLSVCLASGGLVVRIPAATDLGVNVTGPRR